jgi:hypothetical protein
VNNVGVEISIIKPKIQKTKRKGGGIKADTNHKPAEIEKPIEYRVTSGRVEGTCLPVRRYSITRMVRIAA